MIRKIAEKIKGADAILIGASNGLSITEGLHLFADDQAFEDLFGDLKEKYGLTCILHGMSAQWPAEEEKWGFWSRLIHHYCGEYKETKVMSDLKAVIGEKDYFVITSNGECHFEMCGFDPEKICEIEGTFLKKYHGKNLVILELGIRWRNQLIKAPLMRLTAKEPNAAYITINLGEVYIAEDIKEKSFGVDGYLDETFAALKKESESFC